MKPKTIKEGEPFIMNNTTFTYKVEGSKIVLSKVGIVKPSAKFVPPTLEEVKAFFKEKGYNEETAERAWTHYENGEPKWTDTTGKPVKAWKQKMLTNWCKPENKVIDKPKEDRNPMTGMVM